MTRKYENSFRRHRSKSREDHLAREQQFAKRQTLPVSGWDQSLIPQPHFCAFLVHANPTRLFISQSCRGKSDIASEVSLGYLIIVDCDSMGLGRPQQLY